MTLKRISSLLSLISILFVLNAYGIFEFKSWPQIEDLHSSNMSLSELSDHPHFYRYLISLPGLLIEDYFFNFGFSLYISIFMLCSIGLMYFKLKEKHGFIILFSCAAIFFGHLFMNGRGAISWFGWMIILSIVSDNKYNSNIKTIAITLFALLCCSVSSGTFTVAFSVIVTFLVKELVYNRSYQSIFTLLAVYISYIDLAFEGINRNLSYYSLGSGNPIINMLEHGFGNIVRENAMQFAAIAAIIFVSMTFIMFSMRHRLKLWEFICLAYPLAGGIFGYTTLTLIFPSIILVLSSRIGISSLNEIGQRKLAIRDRVSPQYGGI